MSKRFRKRRKRACRLGRQKVAALRLAAFMGLGRSGGIGPFELHQRGAEAWAEGLEHYLNGCFRRWIDARLSVPGPAGLD